MPVTVTVTGPPGPMQGDRIKLRLRHPWIQTGALIWCAIVYEATAGLQNVLSENKSVQVPILSQPEDETSHLSLLLLEFEPLPLGSVKARGWLQDQLELMADGLPRHEHDFYRIVKDNPWLGGDQDHSARLIAPTGRRMAGPRDQPVHAKLLGTVPDADGLDPTGRSRGRDRSPDAHLRLHPPVHRPDALRITPRANDTISIYHGALLYAIPITYNLTSSRVPGYDSAPPNVLNRDLVPISLWAYAIDPSTLRFTGMEDENESGLQNPVWTLGAPTSVRARVCEIDWPMVDGYAANPPLKGERRCVGRPFHLDLVPYGSAKLHMAELPVMSLGG
ncbi:hypothetical protein BO70DRAFT_431548 [Aspergillus heteromorphus CBS 117.55]|uniref:Uncharacterized protein n=1 Tax=Aspergillus heteromorphus CBS 117.55 TaxID=1448321 RepID=A0A317VIC7_9EURO|nr:uncharacterized protein BO70DRAFT_431548 [Aspergillus heteromorphus CBS 117.55]PWY72937.1 hypothetical protein BO70DRAFT_431548 [Aspergillus heteromorphus CBS 117.55]